VKQVTLALAVTLLAGCPPLPQGIDQTFEAGVAAGYAQAQDDIEQLRTELARLTVDVDALQAELDVTHALADENEARVSEVEDRVDSADLALLTLSTDLDVLTFDALRTDDLEIYPNETESADGGAYYALPDDGAWHQLELVETGCRFVYVKLKIRATAVGGDVDTVRRRELGPGGCAGRGGRGAVRRARIAASHVHRRPEPRAGRRGLRLGRHGGGARSVRPAHAARRGRGRQRAHHRSGGPPGLHSLSGAVVQITAR
jgi:outer membrane murein-binding lipoprotein Lpp